MRMTSWWLRGVGGFYLLLSAANLIGLFVAGDGFIAGNLPAALAAEPLAARAFADAWLVFVLELGVLGGMALVAARTPERGRLIVLTIIWAEVFRGVLADAIWISRGYSAVLYGIFIAVHLAIIGSGWLVTRAEPGRTD